MSAIFITYYHFLQNYLIFYQYSSFETCDFINLKDQIIFLKNVNTTSQKAYSASKPLISQIFFTKQQKRAINALFFVQNAS